MLCVSTAVHPVYYKEESHVRISEVSWDQTRDGVSCASLLYSSELNCGCFHRPTFKNQNELAYVYCCPLKKMCGEK